MATIKFILRCSIRKGDHPGKLCARIIHGRKVRVLTLNISLYPNEWDDPGQRIVLREESVSRLRYLNKAVEDLDRFCEEFDSCIEKLERGGYYSVQDISLNSCSHYCLSGIKGFSKHLCRQLEQSGRERTARAYRTSVRALLRFTKSKDIPLKYLNCRLIKEFESWLKSGGKAMNTISYYMRMLRAIYYKAVAEHLICSKQENPFHGVFTGFEETRKRALSPQDLRELHNLDFSDLLTEPAEEITRMAEAKENPLDKSLYDCWRYFFFCFHARGMSFVDMAYLRKENIRHGAISYYRKKTGKKIEVGLSDSLKRIIDSFAEEVEGSPFVFPIIRDASKPHRLQYESGLKIQNLRLKRLSRLAGICPGWGLTTHVSRHSWATAGKYQHLPLSVISEALGHRSEKTTFTYLASFERSILDQAGETVDLFLLNPECRPEIGGLISGRY